MSESHPEAQPAEAGFPTAAFSASLIWVVVGVGGLFVLLMRWLLAVVNFPEVDENARVGEWLMMLGVVPVIFLTTGVFGLLGRTRSHVGGSVLSLFFGVLFVIPPLGMIQVGTLVTRPGNIILVVLLLLGGGLLLVAGVLALCGNGAYLRWREAQR